MFETRRTDFFFKSTFWLTKINIAIEYINTCTVIEVKRTVTVQLVGSCSDLWKKVYWVLIWKWNIRWTVIWKEVLLNSTFDFKNHHCYWINQHFDLNLLSYFRKVPSPVADSLISTSVENSKWRILSHSSYCWCKCIYNMCKVWKYFCCFQKKKNGLAKITF